MTISDEILEKYRAVSKGKPGNEIYVEGDSALCIPADCENLNVVIIGVDAFTVVPGCTIPHMDGIADYSPRVKQPWEEFRRKCNRAALNFMKKMHLEKGANVYFTFVIIDFDEYTEAMLKL